jgi:hypothetical protein
MTAKESQSSGGDAREWRRKLKISRFSEMVDMLSTGFNSSNQLQRRPLRKQRVKNGFAPTFDSVSHGTSRLKPLWEGPTMNGSYLPSKSRNLVRNLKAAHPSAMAEDPAAATD